MMFIFQAIFFELMISKQIIKKLKQLKINLNLIKKDEMVDDSQFSKTNKNLFKLKKSKNLTNLSNIKAIGF